MAITKPDNTPEASTNANDVRDRTRLVLSKQNVKDLYKIAESGGTGEIECVMRYTEADRTQDVEFVIPVEGVASGVALNYPRPKSQRDGFPLPRTEEERKA